MPLGGSFWAEKFTFVGYIKRKAQPIGPFGPVMEDLWTPAAESTLRDEFLGFTTYTIALIFGIIVGIFIVRRLTMRFAPTVLEP